MPTAYTLFFNKKLMPGQIPEGTSEPVPKTTTEKYTLMDTAVVKLKGPLATYTAVEIEAEDKEAAAEYARVFLGATIQESEVRLVATASLESSPAQ